MPTGPQAHGTFPVIGEKGARHIQLVTKYKHLGSVAHHSGDLKSEIKQKAAMAHSAFNMHKKLLFQNVRISQKKRAELFQMLVMSQFTYGAESWVVTD